MKSKNPFEYEGANNLPVDDIIDFYIEDYNFSRTLQSTRNIFLIGERGSGKTMTLLFNSFKIQYKKAKLEGSVVILSRIGIYIPCNTPLFHKKEYEFLIDEPFKASVLSEHYLAMSLVYYICDCLQIIDEIREETLHIESQLFFDFEYLLGVELVKGLSFFESVQRFLSRENVLTQKKINSFDSNGFYENSYTFSSLVIPFLNTIKQLPALSSSHFMFLIDDAHDLNKYQTRTINSWIAYRDRSIFSFKVATAKVNRPELITAVGGSILEGHDFITVDLEKPFQYENSDFFFLAKEIIERRLKNIGLTEVTAESFFPVNPVFEEGLREAEEEAVKIADEKFLNGSSKQKTDFVYKYRRAIYFRSRHSKSNLPPYSGLQTLVDISTGVIRNLLDPCYYMYENELDRKGGVIAAIPPSTQDKIIVERSKLMWKRLQTGLHKEVEGCSIKQSNEIVNMFDNLMILFESRLLRHKSEPRAITFSISQKNTEEYNYVLKLLSIAQQAQLIYTRIGNAKDDGKQETYYVPNRILFPSRGLDPHGQYARVSIKSKAIYDAAVLNKQFPYTDNDTDVEVVQGGLFNE